MITTLRRIAATTAVTGVVAGGMALSMGAASANPSEAPCTAADVNVTVTKEPSAATGHEAFRIDYTAATPHTNCKLQGVPADVVFTDHGAPIHGVKVIPDGGVAEPVNLTAHSPAHSYLLQATQAAPHATIPTSVDFALPSTAPNTREVAAWPAGEQIKGVLQVTPITQS